MRPSIERLTQEAASTGFRPEVLEKVFCLLDLLEGLARHTFLRGRIALKGGTALNLFVFDVPRLSVDIDLNYVGAVERAAMLAERPQVERALAAVCDRQGFAVQRVPDEHAGGKWHLRYDSALGQSGNLQVDLNFMFRVPLWPVEVSDSRPVGSHSARGVPILDLHELAAGKLAALFSRRAARDLFDVCNLLTEAKLDTRKLRLAFVVYGAMSRRDWREISLDDVNLGVQEAHAALLPMLRKSHLNRMGAPSSWLAAMLQEVRGGLEALIAFNGPEREFLDRLLDAGEVRPELLTDDSEMAHRIAGHPALLWKAENVRSMRM